MLNMRKLSRKFSLYSIDCHKKNTNPFIKIGELKYKIEITLVKIINQTKSTINVNAIKISQHLILK